MTDKDQKNVLNSVIEIIKNRDWLSLILIFALGAYNYFPFLKEKSEVEDLKKQMEVYELARRDSDTLKKAATDLVLDFMSQLDAAKREIENLKKRCRKSQERSG